MSTSIAPGASPHHSNLEESAASAALHSHRDTSTATKQSASSVLDDDGRLSSASAALSLKYARAQDLPSFPSTGGVKLASAGAAASLADSNKKPFEHWTPGDSPYANTAAEKARDYKMEPLWKPELSSAGSKAALLAQRDATPVNIWTAPESGQGQSAASSALQNSKSPPAITERNLSGDSKQKALLAATASLRGGRKRADSAPLRPVAPSGNSGWALKAAMSSHNNKGPATPAPLASSSDMTGADPARIQNMAQKNVNRQMYTANPPVAIEVEERRRQDTLRASAVAMAKKMYAIQQVQIDEARGIHRSESHYAAHTARRRAQSDAANKPAPVVEAPRYENLEEAARRLAQERLSKIHDEHAEYRQYYGQSTSPQKSRSFMRRGRQRPGIPEDDDDSDLEDSRKIRQQMSLFQGKLADVDNKKRQADRDALLAAAHKNVTARMNAMDEKVFSDTGKTSTHQRELWERQARERAQRESDNRMINVGKVHIGGGKYLEQEEIDAIARARLQPTLDEISRKAEEQRARDEELRLEQERIKAEQEAEKTRQAQLKAEQKAVTDREKAEQRAQRVEEKRVQQEQKHEERRVRTEQKNAEDERKRAEMPTGGTGTGRSRFLPTFLGRSGAAAGAGAGAATATAATTAVDAVAGDGTTVPITSGAPEDAPDGLEGETVHDMVTVEPAEGVNNEVTMDPSQAAHAVAEANTEDSVEPTEIPLPADEEDVGPLDDVLPKDDVGPKDDVPPKDDVIATSSAEPKSTEETKAAALPMSPISPTSPSKRNSKVKSFFNRFKTASRSENEYVLEKPAATHTTPVATTTIAPETSEPVKEEEAAAATDSFRDVAFAGRNDEETEDMYGGSVKPRGRVSPMEDEVEPTPETNESGPAAVADHTKERDISPPSDTSSVAEDPFVMAADVASSRYSTEHGTGSKRNSGYDQVAQLTDEEEEPRGRKGFRERFFKKVMPGKDKDKRQPGGFTSSAVGSSAAAQTAATPIVNQAVTESASTPATKVQSEPTGSATAAETHADEESEVPDTKVQEPSTTSTEATGATTVTGTTTPALTHTQTNGDDDDDFEEARDTFDEGRLVSASKVDSGSARIVDVPAATTTSKSRTSGEGSRFTEEL